MVMLENGVIPIVNENDTVSVTELMFTDNDELSGLIATMMDVQALIILSNVDGIYNGLPGEPGVEVIREVEPERDLQEYIRTEKSGFGRGGMMTKCSIARKVADEGIEVIIANGKRDDVLTDLVLRPGSRVCTRLLRVKAMFEREEMGGSQHRVHEREGLPERQGGGSRLRRPCREYPAGRGHACGRRF